VSGPSVTISAATSPVAGFTPTAEGDYVFRLTVSDGQASDTDEVLVRVAEPWANAGPDLTRVVGNTIALAGSGGTENPSASVAYAWTQVSPASPVMTLSGATAPATGFFATAAGVFVFRLTVTIVGGESAHDEVTITIFDPVVNVAPVADAGADLPAEPGDNVILDGSASWDPNDDPITHAWDQLSGPAVMIHSADRDVAFFTPTETGEYVFRLTVSDGALESTDSVVVTVTAATNEPPPAGVPAPEALAVRPNLVLLSELSAVRILAPDRLAETLVTIYGLSGDVAAATTLVSAGGFAEAALDPAWGLAAGAYLAVLEAEGSQLSARFVVAR
jgi:hypothetical protein